MEKIRNLKGNKKTENLTFDTKKSKLGINKEDNISNLRFLSDIIDGKTKEEIIAFEEERYMNQIREVAKQVIKKRRRVILLSGPSGSGKTTTAHRLQEELEKRGRKTYVFSMDNWYKTRTETNMPLDEEGNIDYESPEALELTLLNKDINTLERLKPVRIPHFNFETKTMTYSNDAGAIQLNSKKDIVIIEGIHALNPLIKVRGGLRVYINPEDIHIDGDGVITGRDIRLCRRIVRDSRHRGMTAEATIKKCKSVTRGEMLYIEPNRKNVDITINSLIGYELLIHQYELQSLDAVKEIIKFGKDRHIPEITAEDIPKGSVLEEFYR